MSLNNKQILLGVTGGIAAYKSADLVRRLRDEGATVRVIMTANAKEFITPLTMQAVSGHPIHDDLFDLAAEAAMGHIELARWADLVIVAPASADFMARLATGQGNDLLTTVCLAATTPVVVAPAMNGGMWKNSQTQKNVQALKDHGVSLLGPDEGSQACGDVGYGRMLEPLSIVKELAKQFATGSLAKQRVIITAGPTREFIDPMRYISNLSSGKMGYCMAQAALEAGADVTLISGPVSLSKPPRLTTIDVVSAQEMLEQVRKHTANCDIFISVAAVADFKCETISAEKIPKNSLSLNLPLIRTTDIVAEVAQLERRPFIVGFAAESHNLLGNAAGKLHNKNLDMIFANEVSSAVGGLDNSGTMLWKDGQQEFPLMSKAKLAREMITLIADIYTKAKQLTPDADNA